MDETLISKIPLFAGLPTVEISYLAKTLQLREIPAGKILFREGGQDDRFYILLEGQVEVFKTIPGQSSAGLSDSDEDQQAINGEERYLGVLEKGALIGEMSLFSRDGRHTANVRALTSVRLLEMTKADFDALLHRQPDMTYDLVRLLSRRLERSENITILDLQSKNRQLVKAYQQLEAAQALLVEKEKLEHELELARQIQLQILPEEVPSLPGFDFGALIVPARAVGGDFYDFIPLDEERIGVVVGDVSDKGIPAAMYMTLSYSLIRAEAQRLASPAETLQSVNRYLLDISTSGMFVTVLYGILDQTSREFRFARAGHEYPIILDDEGRQLELAHTSGRLMGLFDDLSLEEECIIFPPGGSALIYSDGVTEAMNEHQELYGASRAMEFLGKRANIESTPAAAKDICDQLLTELRSFVGNVQQQDDITILAIQG
jgi:serine phosphatase RsbU (regulator of sigma subunit)